MTDSTSPSQTPLESQRVPLEREVVLEFEHFSSFIREYSANISLGGMFVKTSERRLPGTVFRFEIRLADDAPLIAGLAKVLWVRDSDQGDDRPAGMGVRFLQIEAEGRHLIERIVREHRERGGEPFRLEPPPPAPAEEPSAAANESPPEPPPGAAAPAAGPEPLPSPDVSTVIELPPLEELLQETAKTPKKSLTLDTPPRGWKPGISAVRPRTRPQLLLTIAIAAVIVTLAVFFLLRRFAGPPELDRAELTPRELPRVEEGAAGAAASEEPALPRFTALEELSWQRRGDAAEVVVRVDGSLPEGSWSESRMPDPPRHLVKLIDASRPYPTETFEVGFGGVRQLRTGYHSLPAGNEQHVVIDLVDPRVVLDAVEVEQQVLRLRFRRLGR